MPNSCKILIVFFLFVNYLWAQNNESKTSLGVNFSSDYAYRNLKNTEDAQWIVDFREEVEKPIFGFHGGFSFYHKFQKGIFIETGLQYSRFGDKKEDMEIISSSGMYSMENKFITYYDYLAIPVKVAYSITFNERFSLFVSPGLSTHFFLSYRFLSRIDYDDGTSSSSSSSYYDNPFNFEPIHFILHSSIGLDVNLNDSWSLRFEPTYRTSLSTAVDAPIQQRFFSFGLNTGVYYSFRVK